MTLYKFDYSSSYYYYNVRCSAVSMRPLKG